MIVGYSLSPGVLLFPNHIGTLTALSYHQYLQPSNPIAGSSAGAIAVASHGAGLPPAQAIDATVRMSNAAREIGGATGNLLPLLQSELANLLDDNVHETLNEREGFVGLAHRQVFPSNTPILETFFEDKDHVMDSICNSSMFPFFSTQWPARWARKRLGDPLPRLVVDGYFTVPRDRFGCPDLNMNHAWQEELESAPTKEMENDEEQGNTTIVDRTITISVFPHESISLTASLEQDRISPAIQEDSTSQMSNLFRLATQCATREEYTKLYEDGWKDAEKWIKEEERRGYWGQTTSERRKMYGNVVQQSLSRGSGGVELNEDFQESYACMSISSHSNGFSETKT